MTLPVANLISQRYTTACCKLINSCCLTNFALLLMLQVRDQSRLCPCMKLCLQVSKQYGWEPKVSLREGLANMVDDFRERLSVTTPDEEALEDNVLAK